MEQEKLKKEEEFKPLENARAIKRSTLTSDQESREFFEELHFSEGEEEKAPSFTASSSFIADP